MVDSRTSGDFRLTLAVCKEGRGKCMRTGNLVYRCRYFAYAKGEPAMIIQRESVHVALKWLELPLERFVDVGG